MKTTAKKYIYLLCENNGNRYYKKLSTRALLKLSNTFITFEETKPKNCIIF